MYVLVSLEDTKNITKSKNRTKQINKKCDLKEMICEKTIEMGIV